MNYDASANYNDGSCLYPGASMSSHATPTRGHRRDGSCLYLNDVGVRQHLPERPGRRRYATTWTTVGEFDVCGICNGPGAVFGGCSFSPGIAIATGTNWTPWACAGATVWRTPMEMASATSTTTVSGSTTRAASATDPTGLRMRMCHHPCGRLRL